MLRSLFDRFFGSRRAPAVVPPPAQARPRAPREPGPPPVGIGARRPLVNARGELAGFEFHAGAAGRLKLRRVEDEVTVRAVVANVMGAMRLCLSQQLTPLAEFPATWLARSAADELFEPGMHLVLCRDALFDDAAARTRLVARLRGLGCRVGWRAVDVPPSEPPDFLLLNAPAANDRVGWQQASDDLARERPGIAQVALDLPDIDSLEALLRGPLLLGACALGGVGLPAGPRVALSPQGTHLLRLLSRLTRDEDNALLVADIKADAALALRLLQFLNSAGASPGRPLDSIDQAVMVLGRDALYRWAAQMVVRLSPSRPSTAALQAMALARARFFELLARTAGEAQPGQLYLFGLVSMLPRLLGCNQEEAVASLDLPPTALRALLEGQGDWYPYVALARAIDGHDLAAAAALAERFGGLPAVLALSARAWTTV